VFVAEDNGDIVGTYCLQANQKGGGAHVANCGYNDAVSATAGAWPERCARIPGPRAGARISRDAVQFCDQYQ